MAQKRQRWTATHAPDTAVYVFKVALSARKSVWRRIAVLSDQTLHDLHAAIFEAFDRFDEHLYSYYLPQPGARGGRAALRDAVEYTSPMMLLGGPDPFGFGGPEPHDAGETEIRSLGLTAGSKLSYLFDFGDEWWHDITVEQIDAKPEKGKYPRITHKRGDSPPQYPDPEENEA